MHRLKSVGVVVLMHFGWSFQARFAEIAFIFLLLDGSYFLVCRKTSGDVFRLFDFLVVFSYIENFVGNIVPGGFGSGLSSLGRANPARGAEAHRPFPPAGKTFVTHN